MKKYIILLSTLVLCFSCKPKIEVKKPDNLITKDKMENLLHDMFVINSAKGVGRTKFEKAGLDPQTYILKKYKIDSLQYAESNTYYAHDIEAYKSMIEKVKKRLTSEKEKYAAIEKEEQKERDQIKDSLKKQRQTLKANPNLDSKKLQKKINPNG